MTDIFKKACLSLEPFRSKAQERKPELKDDALLNLHPKFEALYSTEEIEKQLSFCLFIAPDKEESHIDIPKIRNSVEFIGDVSTRVISFINKSKSDNTVNTILSSDELLQLMKQFTEVQRISLQIRDKIKEALQPDESTTECSNYHRSVLDLEFVSTILKSTTKEIDKYSDGKDKNLLKRITDILTTIKNKVQLVVERFYGIISHVGTRMIESLDNLYEEIKKGPNAILNAFISLSERLLDLVGQLTEEMFKFLTQLGVVAKKQGYELSNIDIKIPSVKFALVQLFMFSIPLPMIETPEILLSVEFNK